MQGFERFYAYRKLIEALRLLKIYLYMLGDIFEFFYVMLCSRAVLSHLFYERKKLF
jgi:hypothetical protein